MKMTVRAKAGRRLALTTAAAMACSGAAWAQTRNFDIPAQPASTGIPAFARQAGVQILAPADLAGERRVGPVIGSYSVRAALAQLLSPSGLTVASDDGRTIALTAAPVRAIHAAWTVGTAAPAEPTAAAPAPSDEPSGVSEVIVTGTRAKGRTVLSSSAPIDVLSATELTKSGLQSTRDLISTLVPSAVSSTGGAGASFAVKSLSLRGLSGDQTLVLVDGKRRHDTAILFVNGTTQNGQSPPDLDLIPAASIKRIEVLRDGASAQYGSDALAGVINIILKNADNGGALTALAGETASADGATGDWSANMGFHLGSNGFLNLTGYVRTQDLTDRGQTLSPAVQLYFPINGAPDPREATANRHVSHPGTPQVQLYSTSYNGQYSLTPGVDFYSFGTYTSRNSVGWLTFRRPVDLNNNVNVYPDGYSPRLFLDDRDYQIVGGFKGSDLFGFTWDLSSSYSEDHVDYDGNSLNASLGPLSPQHFYLGFLQFDEWTTNLDVTRKVPTGFLTQPLLVAAGLEYRNDALKIGAGDATSYENGGYVAPLGAPQAGKVTAGGAQGVTGFPPFAAGDFSRDNTSAYVDLEQALTSRWDVSAAARYEHYSDFGDHTTAKASSRYEIVSGLAVRGTISSGFRAPSLQQEHYASSSTIGVVVPPSTTTVLYPVQLLPPNNPAAIALGAKPLKPEESLNYSVGLVAQPLPHLSATVDLYQIKITNRILQTATLGPSTIVSNALASQNLNPQQAVFYYANAASTTTRGIDAVIDYRSDFGQFGAVRWSLSANLNHTRFDKIEAPPPALAAAGLVLVDRTRKGDFTDGTPHNKFILGADWTLGKFDTNLRLTKFGQVTQRTSNPLNATLLDDRVSPAVLVDLDIAYKLNDHIQLSIGANNLLNKLPDELKPANQGAPVPFAYYNSYAPYGLVGGFYYARASYSF